MEKMETEKRSRKMQFFRFNFDTFKKVKENDGIYTLTITLKDKAGNTETTAITFTINRFGSVYEYSDYLTDLIADGGAYVKAVDDDLVITEYNADKLVENSLNIVITKDGKLLDQSEYTITPTMNNKVSTGESGWYQYDYTISKDNFTSDGVYKMVVSQRTKQETLRKIQIRRIRRFFSV